ncbi:LGFP repeat-containing protein [Nonomuraea sp. NPDC059194]|uniref:LGFP repeat-containing protein n=1 Tax=Nonomuraea sp. NPDC059194 TaxID=3346764 RepID=UPI00367565B0
MPTTRALLGAAAVTAAVALLAPATAQASTTQASTTAATSSCNPALIAPHGSLIGGLWRDNNGENSVYGCPVTREFGFENTKGSWQRFENGKIVWSPNVGGGALLRVFKKNGKMFFKWDGMGRDWDFFNVRWSKDAELGNRTTQVKVKRLTPWSGQFSITTNPAVDFESTSSHGRSTDTWRFVVQGCDRGTFSSDCGPWSITNVYTY